MFDYDQIFVTVVLLFFLSTLHFFRWQKSSTCQWRLMFFISVKKRKYKILFILIASLKRCESFFFFLKRKNDWKLLGCYWQRCFCYCLEVYSRWFWACSQCYCVRSSIGCQRNRPRGKKTSTNSSFFSLLSDFFYRIYFTFIHSHFLSSNNINNSNKSNVIILYFFFNCSLWKHQFFSNNQYDWLIVSYIDDRILTSSFSFFFLINICLPDIDW